MHEKRLVKFILICYPLSWSSAWTSKSSLATKHTMDSVLIQGKAPGKHKLELFNFLSFHHLCRTFSLQLHGKEHPASQRPPSSHDSVSGIQNRIQILVKKFGSWCNKATQWLIPKFPENCNPNLPAELGSSGTSWTWQTAIEPFCHK